MERRPYHGGVFHQGHVVPAERHHEQHRPDVLETANPLPPLSSLASNIVHPKRREMERTGMHGFFGRVTFDVTNVLETAQQQSFPFIH